MMPTELSAIASIDEKRKRLAELLRAGAARPKYHAVSVEQRRFWMLYQLDPNGAGYNLPSFIRLSGVLNVNALRAAFREIVRRHEVLRTTFPMRDGEPVQEIHPPADFALPMVDLSGLPGNAREEVVKELRQEEADRAFNAIHGPLFRAMLVRLGACEHELQFSMHHIVSDGWSEGLLSAELQALYNSAVTGKASPLPECMIQYADYAAWQRKFLASPEAADEMQYWVDRLAGTPLLDLPVDGVRGASSGGRQLGYAFRIPVELGRRLQQWSQSERVTVFMTLLAGFQWLLSRYSGIEDVAVGTVTANRSRVETESLIGPFVNTIVLRTDVGGSPSFRELVARVRTVTLDAFLHGAVPFEKLVEKLAPERQLDESPLVQAALWVQNLPTEPLQFSGLQAVSGLEVTPWIPSLNLTMELKQCADGGLEGTVMYKPSLFEERTIYRLTSHFAILLTGALANPDAPLPEIPLLDTASRRQLLEDWNHTEQAFPRTSLAELFEAQVERTPDAIAVTFEGTRYSYRDLNARVNRLAAYLQSRGLGVETRVGIFLDRSAEMLIALLSVIKAGGAYIPLDPSYPADRLAYMLEDSQAAMLLSEKPLREKLPSFSGAVVLIDELQTQIERFSAENPGVAVHGKNLVYILYTSGSTGRPKGVGVCHDALVNCLLSIRNKPGMQPGDVILGISSICFDISTTDLYLPLIVGAEVRILSRDASRDGVRLVREIKNGVTIVQATPATWAMILESCWTPAQPVKAFCGGEALLPSMAEKLLGWSSEAWDLYGPTEATVWSLIKKLDGGKVVVGKPLSNTTAYILDRDMEPVPVGLPGELYLGGVQLARGYVNRPELTAERFVPDPFSRVRGQRLYRTGDLARWTNAGDVEYLGRLDQQVKVLGHRIELGEIESALTAHPAVKQSVVIACGEGEQKRLAAFVVPFGAPIDMADLEATLRAKLPEYMIPALIIPLAALPLTGSGKIDRKALPVPQLVDIREGSRYLAPRDETEKKICAIWADVLGLERVGIDSNFFALGGHSLLAMRATSRVNAELRVDLELRTLFEWPTVAGLAGQLKKCNPGLEDGDEQIRKASRSGDIPLSFAQRRIWFVHQLQPESTAYNAPTCFRLTGEVDPLLIARCLTEIVRRHEALRTTFPERNGEPVQVIHPAAPVQLPVIDLTALAPEDRAEAARQLRLMDAARLFNLARGPLLEMRLVRLGIEEHELHLATHHITTDGWALDVFVRELLALRRAFLAGCSSPLPELEIQYADYSVWQRERLETTLVEKHLPYWRRQLEGVPVSEFPADRPRPQLTVHPGVEMHFELQPAQGQALTAFSQREGATLFMVLLAGFQWLLGRYAGQEDIAVGSVIAGRTRKATESLIGVFINTLVLRTDLSGCPSFRELVARVREVTLGAYAHEDFPFEKLVEQFNLSRDLAHSPLFQVRFTFEPQTQAATEVAGLRVEEVDMPLPEVKFDLSLNMGYRENGALRGCLVYAADLFERETMDRLVRRYERLLKHAIALPDAPLPEISMLDDDEQQYALAVAGKLPASSRAVCLHRLFEEQAERTPHAIALVDENGKLTYSELNATANRVARHLVEIGVGCEARVGILLERSLHFVVALLGVLKAGAAYVPIDSSYPAERIEYVLNEGSIAVLVTREQLRERLPSYGVQAVCLDSDWPAICEQSAENVVSLAGPANLAYAIFTSGSTGKPKAVGVEHRQVSSYLQAVCARMDCSPNWRFALLSTIAADLGNTILFASLCHGGELHVISDECAREPRRLQEYFRRQHIDCAKITPSQLASLQVLHPSENLLPARLLILGGEASQWSWVEELRSLRPGCRVMNHYGPTECAIGSVACLLDEERKAGSPNVPLGHPLGNASVYVLDERMRLQLPGMPGELYIGGYGVARGYLGREDLTAERFLPDPFSAVPGARMYRTGDKCRWNADGALEFLGRIDRQVKIRGFRVELGEIEARLNQHPDVRQSAVVLMAGEAGGKLVSYVSLRGAAAENTPHAERLKDFLRNRLPEYMLPSAVVVLPELPLTANGKLDRRALPPVVEATAPADSFVAPSNETEKRLCEIWSEVLGVERVGVHDNFFDLGGHSLLATKVASRIEAVMNVEIQLVALFHSPTVAKLAFEVEKARAQGSAQRTIPIVPVRRDAFRFTGAL